MELTVRDIQILLKKMIVEVVGICDRNSINYYLVKGGLIGAIKYQGFIPWDPDVDFVINVKDLNRFCHCVAKELSDSFQLCFYSEDKKYEYLFPRIGVKGLDYRQLHLDIFLLAFFPDDVNKQKHYYNSLYRLELLNTLRNSKISRPINNLFYRIVLIISRVMLFWVPRNFIRDKYLEILHLFDYGTKYVIHAGAVEEYGKKYIMPEEWFGSPVLKKFEDIELKCPLDYDSYLKQMYGNYKENPPLAEQTRQLNRRWILKDEIIEKLIDKDEWNKG